MTFHPYVVIATVAVLLFYLSTGVNVARHRRRHGLAAPAMSGHPEVERALRVQGNTLEWLAMFVPALWMFAAYHDPRLSAAVAAVWIVGRVIYMMGYMADADRRGPGFLIQALATAAALFGGLGGAIAQVLHTPGA